MDRKEMFNANSFFKEEINLCTAILLIENSCE
jgi:hypothetical protein